MAKPKENAITDPDNVSMKVVDEPKYDVATAYALLSGGTVPPVIRGEDVETV